jgi:hypothetical protein
VLERIEKLQIVEKADQIPRVLIEKGTLRYCGRAATTVMCSLRLEKRYDAGKSDEEAASLSQKPVQGLG